MKTSLLYIVISVIAIAILIPFTSGLTEGGKGETQVVKYSLARPSYDGSYGLRPGSVSGPAYSMEDFRDEPLEMEDWMENPEEWGTELNK